MSDYEYTPEKVAELVAVAETWVPSECAASPVGAWHFIERLADALEAVAAERDAHKRAKAENDERFMIERDEAGAELRQERAKVRGLGFALEGTRADRDRLYKAALDALAEAAKGDNRMSDVQRILRAAIDKEGQTDE